MCSISERKTDHIELREMVVGSALQEQVQQLFRVFCAANKRSALVALLG